MPKRDNTFHSNGLPEWVYTYDDEGNLIEEARYNADGSLDYRVATNYHPDGGKTVTTLNPDGTMTVIAYDAEGERGEELLYDAEGNRYQEEHHYFPNGALRERCVSTINLKGQVVAEQYFNAHDKLTASCANRYDALGNLVERSHFDTTGALTERWEYTCDAAGNITETRCYNPDGSLAGRWDGDPHEKHQQKHSPLGFLYRPIF